MISLNKTNFVNKIQQIVENHYLQPIDGEKKDNPKDGYIERSIHGGMHASRATLWAFMTHNLLQQLSPDYVNNSLNKIAQHINADTKTVMRLILIAMACHDAGRKGEGKDEWEKESSLIAFQELKELGLDDEQANLFAKAVLNKDKPNSYQEELKKQGVAEKDYNAFDYIRKLINLGDNLDLVRCVNPFELSYIYNTLKTVEGFDITDHHDMLMSMVAEIHQTVFNQRDMRVTCDVKDINAAIVATHKSNLSHHEKVKYEHADNVFAVMFEELINNPKFKPYLNTQFFELPKSKKYSGELKFDPFIHGTNSSIFATLLKTDFQIMSPLEMMDDYQTSPMSGELTLGGYDFAGTTLIKDENIGRTSFAKIKPLDKNSYSLEDVLSNYTNLRISTQDASLENLKYALASGLECAYSNINLLLIYFTRARQTHESLDEVISKKDLQELQDNLNATVQFYYFIQLLGKYIHPDFDAIEKSGMAKNIIDGAFSLLTFEHIIKKIIDLKIDMQEIYHHPTEENLKKALAVVEFPKTATIGSSARRGGIREVEFPQTQFFCLKGDYSKVLYSYEKSRDVFYQMARNNSGGYPINDLLGIAFGKNLNQEFFLELGKYAEKYIIVLNDRMRVFHKILGSPQSKLTLTEMQKYFLNRSVPIILVSENEEKIALYSQSTQEYRSTSRLKLGTDIKIIATDNNEQRLEIMKFLDLHHVNGIEVVLFSDLKQSKYSKEKPCEPYHHDGGIPTLKWLCAKQAAGLKNYCLFRTNQSLLETGSVYSENNIKESNNLINDARKYSAIQFSKSANHH